MRPENSLKLALLEVGPPLGLGLGLLCDDFVLFDIGILGANYQAPTNAGQTKERLYTAGTLLEFALLKILSP